VQDYDIGRLDLIGRGRYANDASPDQPSRIVPLGQPPRSHNAAVPAERRNAVTPEAPARSHRLALRCRRTGRAQKGTLFGFGGGAFSRWPAYSRRSSTDH
jgi:hypothetical protein